MKNSVRYAILAVVFSVCADARAFTLNFVTNSPAPASNNFQVLSTMPYDGQVLDKSPETVSVMFSLPPKAERAYIKVIDMYGTQVDNGEVTASGVNIFTSLSEVPPGRYTVRWDARCRCTEESELSGSFRFTVRAE